MDSVHVGVGVWKSERDGLCGCVWVCGCMCVCVCSWVMCGGVWVCVCVQLQDKHCTDFAVEKLCVGGVCVCGGVYFILFSFLFSSFFLVLSVNHCMTNFCL